MCTQECPRPQVVLYPIVNLRELGMGARRYVETLEDTMVLVLGSYGLHARVRGTSSDRARLCRRMMGPRLVALALMRCPGALTLIER